MLYRSVSAALMILLASVPPAAAEPSGGGAPSAPEQAAPRATLEVVLPGAAQAMLRDRATGEYQLVRVGDWYQGFQVRGIDREHIVMSSLAGSFHVLSPAPVATAAPAAAPATAVPLATDEALDPYAEQPAPAASGFAPEDPYDASAPEDPYGEVAPPVTPVPVTPAPVTPVPAAPAPAEPAPLIPPPVDRVSPLGGDPAPAPAPAAARAGESIRLGRADFHAALSDFPARSKEIQIAVEAGRGLRVRSVSRGTIFDRLGLRPGDLVRSIAGNRVLSIDDAAPVYARLLSADSFVIEVDRAGTRLDLRVELIRNQ